MTRFLISATLLGLLAACSSSSGAGTSSPPQTVVVIPPGQKLVCMDGTAPPCR